MAVMKNNRRRNALEMLQTQLKSGTKTEKGTTNKKVPLTDKNKSRIEKEIANLKGKL